MATPRNVTKASRAADKIHAQVYNADAPEGEDTLPGEKPIDAKAENSEDLEKVAGPATEAEETEAEAEAEAQPEEVAGPATEAQPAAPAEDWEHKYRSLAGHNEALNKRLNELELVLASIPQGPQDPPESKTQAAAPATLLTDEDREDYGEDLIDVIRRAAREELTPLQQKIASLEAENAHLRSAFGGVSKNMAKTARQSVYDELTKAVPDWETVNKDPDFLAWLSEVDVYAGRKRGDMLQEAFQKSDAPRVRRFFEGFAAERTSVSQEQQAPVAGRNPKTTLNDMVAPGRPRNAGNTTAAQDGKKLWQQREVQAFYADVQRGRYRGKEKEKNRLERDIIAAANEGRITA